MSAASKAILQRDAQPSAFIYKGYKKRNPFEIVTDEDLADYRREVCILYIESYNHFNTLVM